jgi:hypothetical protein
MKHSVLPHPLVQNSIKQDFALSMLRSLQVVPAILRVLSLAFVNPKSFHRILLELSLVNIAIRKHHHTSPLHGVFYKRSLVLAAIRKAVSAKPLLETIDKGSFVHVAVGMNLSTFSMRNVVFELSLVHDFGFMVDNLVVRRVGEEIPIERVGNFVESLRLEILAAAIGVVSHK